MGLPRPAPRGPRPFLVGFSGVGTCGTRLGSCWPAAKLRSAASKQASLQAEAIRLFIAIAATSREIARDRAERSEEIAEIARRSRRLPGDREIARRSRDLLRSPEIAWRSRGSRHEIARSRRRRRTVATRFGAVTNPRQSLLQPCRLGATLGLGLTEY